MPELRGLMAPPPVGGVIEPRTPALSPSSPDPLARRSLSRSLHLLTAHDHANALPEHDWAALVRGGILDVHMGVRTLPQLVTWRLAAGMNPAAPAVCGAECPTPVNATCSGLADVAAQVATAGGDGPMLMLIGGVVGMARCDALGDTARHEAA